MVNLQAHLKIQYKLHLPSTNDKSKVILARRRKEKKDNFATKVSSSIVSQSCLNSCMVQYQK